jgi:hypothetical protein
MRIFAASNYLSAAVREYPDLCASKDIMTAAVAVDGNPSFRHHKGRRIQTDAAGLFCVFRSLANQAALTACRRLADMIQARIIASRKAAALRAKDRRGPKDPRSYTKPAARDPATVPTALSEL